MKIALEKLSGSPQTTKLYQRKHIYTYTYIYIYIFIYIYIYIFVMDINNNNNQLTLHGVSWVLPNLQMAIQYYLTCKNKTTT